MTADFNNEFELFERAIELPSEQRRQFVIEQCVDAPLRDAVLDLIAHYESQDTLVIDKPLFVDTAVLSNEASEGDQIGPYRLDSLLGEGGMGSVWVAQQFEPVNRHVALKIIKPGYELPGMLKRFEIERQALALMDHPGIAKVFDAGTTKSGQPFFVMELIDGQPLVDYCDGRQLSLKSRLKIFLKIANAVQHAHHRAIIHRDLKPNNILVSEHDGESAPKIIDFGLAKSIGGEVKDTVLTQIGTVMGTLEYMAPEQASFSGHQADTRTDIYALGVILYELLTGDLPYGRNNFSSVGIDDRIKLIREMDPIRPSYRISENGHSSTISSRSDSRVLMQQFRNELDWVVLKALEKDRNLRYQSASEFATDIANFLQGNPINAHPPSMRYRVAKFARKHRTLAFATAIVVLAVIGGIAGLAYGLVRARTAESDAKIDRQAAIDSELEAKKVAKQALLEKRYAEAIADFLKNDFLALTTVEGQVYSELENASLGSSATLIDLLERAAGTLERRDDLEPNARADLLWTVGVSLRQAGHFERAIPFLEECLEIEKQISNDYKGVLNVTNSLAVAMAKAGRTDQAIALQEEVISNVPNDLPATNRSLMACQQSLSRFLIVKKEFAAAREIADALLDLSVETWGDMHKSTVMSLNTLANIDRKEGQLDDAISKYERALKSAELLWPESHPILITCVRELGNTYYDQRRYLKAIERLEQAVDLSEQLFGENDSYSLVIQNDLGAAYWKAKRLDKSIPVFEHVVAQYRQQFDPGYMALLQSQGNLAVNYVDNKQYDEAIELLEEIIELETAPKFVFHELRRAYAISGRTDEFERFSDQLVEKEVEQSSADSLEVAFLYYKIGMDALLIPDSDYAINVLNKAYQIQSEKIPDSPQLNGTKEWLGRAHFDANDLEKSEAYFSEAYWEFKANAPKTSANITKLTRILNYLVAIARKMDDSKKLQQWQTEKQAYAQ